MGHELSSIGTSAQTDTATLESRHATADGARPYTASYSGLGLISTILPTAAYACAVCGGAEDNGYFWGVLFLMSMPFAIGSFVGGWLLYSYRRAPVWSCAHQRRPWLSKDARPGQPRRHRHQRGTMTDIRLITH